MKLRDLRPGVRVSYRVGGEPRIGTVRRVDPDREGNAVIEVEGDDGETHIVQAAQHLQPAPPERHSPTVRLTLDHAGGQTALSQVAPDWIIVAEPCRIAGAATVHVDIDGRPNPRSVHIEPGEYEAGARIAVDDAGESDGADAPDEETVAAWRRVLDQARDLDPAIREALRPIYDRLSAEMPDAAPAMALAMICRALRMLRTAHGEQTLPYHQMICQLAIGEAMRDPDHP